MSNINISEGMAEELEQALNLAIGMSSVHAPSSTLKLIDLAGRLADLINGAIEMDDPDD